MKTIGSFRHLLVFGMVFVVLSACSSTPPAPTIASSFSIPATATATHPPSTDTPLPTDTLQPATETQPPATSTPTAAPTETSVPPSATPVRPAPTANAPTVAPRFTPTTETLPPLVWNVQTGAPGVLSDIMQKTLNRKGIEVSVSNGYAESLTFSFPGNESVNGLVGITVNNKTTYSIVGEPFTIPGNGGFLDTILSPGDYAWSAQISGTGQAQGSLSVQKGEQVLINFGK